MPQGWLLFALLGGATGCGNARNPQAAPPMKAVVKVSKPVVSEVTDYEIFTGHTEAVTSVDIRARVSGYLQEVHFKPGEEVEQGQLLFTIDPRPYRPNWIRARPCSSRPRRD
jgi:multidrug efflux system membrane fusion protein